MNVKKEYSAPRIEVVGTFEGLTQAAGCPGELDGTFPSGTSFNDLTCGLS